MINKQLLLYLLLSLFAQQIDAQSWFENDKIVASDRETNDIFGAKHSIGIWENYAVVGAEQSDQNGQANSGAAYVYEKDMVTCEWVQTQKLTGPSPIFTDFFATSVAIHGNFIVVGARNHDTDTNNTNYKFNAGAAFVFENIAGTWTFTQKIVADDRENEALFGWEVDIYQDHIIVGANYESQDPNLPSLLQSGAAYIFKYNGTDWVQEQKLMASDRSQGDRFGEAVAITNGYAVVGAHMEKHDANGMVPLDQAGSAYVFELSGTTWTEVVKLVPPAADREAYGHYANSVDIDMDGLVIGAFGDNHDENGTAFQWRTGSAFIYRRDLAGNWNLEDKIDASDRAENDYLGYSVSISKELIALGAYREDEDANDANTLLDAGSAYIYRNDGNGNWQEYQKIVSSDRDAGDRFGRSIAIYDEHVIVGAYTEKENDANPPADTKIGAGSAYIFGIGIMADIPTVSSSINSFCSGTTTPVTLSITAGNLNDATDWQWYSGSCNGTVIGTGTSITVNTSFTTTYYVNGIGDCTNPGPCASITITGSVNSSWSQTTQNTAGNDETNDVITDDNGFTYVTGSFITQTTLNGGANSNVTLTSSAQGVPASYIAKYNICGDLLWAAHAVSSKDNVGKSIIVNNTTNIVYITGNFYSNLNFGPSNICAGAPLSLAATSTHKGYVAAFDMTSGCILSLDMVNQDIFTNCQAITIDESNGNLFVGAHSSPNLNGLNHTSFVNKYTPVGNVLGIPVSQITSFSDNHTNLINDMDYDETNNGLWIIGNFKNKVEFTPGFPTLYAQSNSIQQEAFLLGYQDNNNGFTPFIQRRGDTPQYMTGDGIAVDETTGNVYFTGSYRETVTTPFQFNTINSLPPNSGVNAYMIGLDVNAMGGWSRYGSVMNGRAYGKSVAFINNRLFFSGNFSRGTIQLQALGNYPYTVTGTPLAKNHTYIARYETNGTGVWGNVTTDPTSNNAAHETRSMTVNDLGYVYVVGSYVNKMDYNFSTSLTAPIISSGAGYNGFIIRSKGSDGNIYRFKNPTEEIEVKESLDQLEIFPNPTSEKATLRIPGFDNQHTYNLVVMDVVGKVIQEAIVRNERYEVDLSGQKNGIYFIQLSNGGKKLFTKLVKTN